MNSARSNQKDAVRNATSAKSKPRSRPRRQKISRKQKRSCGIGSSAGGKRMNLRRGRRARRQKKSLCVAGAKRFGRCENGRARALPARSEEHTSELQSHVNL